MRSVLRAVATAVCLLACGAPGESTLPTTSTESLRAACYSGHGAVCARLAQRAASEGEFREFAARACQAGDRDSCSYLGEVLLLASKAPRQDEDADADVREGRRLLARGCSLERAALGVGFLCKLASQRRAVSNLEVSSMTGLGTPVTRFRVRRSPASEDVLVPSRRTRLAARGAGLDRVSVTVWVCVGPTGHVHRAAISSESGFPSYDRRAMETVRQWRYAIDPKRHALRLCVREQVASS